MPVRPISFQPNGDIEVVFDELGHSGTIPAAEVVWGTKFDGSHNQLTMPSSKAASDIVANAHWFHVVGSDADRNPAQMIQGFVWNRPEDPCPGEDVGVLKLSIHIERAIAVPLQCTHPYPARRRECNLAPEPQDMRHMGVPESLATDNALFIQCMADGLVATVGCFGQAANRPTIQIELDQLVGTVEVNRTAAFSGTGTPRLKEHRVDLSRGVAPRAVHAAPGLSFYRGRGA